MVCAKAGGLEAAFCVWGSADALVLKDPLAEGWGHAKGGGD